MKTTIEIPEALYKMAKIRAIERGQTLKQIVLTSLEKELGVSVADEDPRPSSWAERKLVPEFQRLSEAGLMKLTPSDRSIDDIVSDINADTEA